MNRLFSPFHSRTVKFRNRIFLSPMCQYSAVEGVPTDWHMVHLGARASGGAGLVMVEATGVVPEGRISPGCTGIWNEKQAEAFKPITEFIRSQGAVPAIQLAHAGRKASRRRAWDGGGPLTSEEGSWQTVGPSALAYSDKDPVPTALGADGIENLLQAFEAAVERSLTAGFDVIELHMAHGYLAHEFLSPLSNKRFDEYGGSLKNRMRFPLELARRARRSWPKEKPLFVRISATDWVEGGWDLEQSIEFCRELKDIGVDLIDCSSGGLSPLQKIPSDPHAQIPLASEIRKKAEVKTGAVGGIQDPRHAESLLVEEKCDVVFIGREMLRNPSWPLEAARELGADIDWPRQYLRARR